MGLCYSETKKEQNMGLCNDIKKDADIQIINEYEKDGFINYFLF